MAAEKFAPTGTVTLTAGTSSSNAALAGAGDSAVIYNSTNGTAFVRFGLDNSVTASTTTDFPVPPGTRAILACGMVVAFVAVVLAAAATSGPVYVSRGSGSQY